MRIKTLFAVVALCAASASADAALLGRDLNGSPGSFEAYYDTTLDITWLANANLALTTTFGVSGINVTNGRMEWATATAWIAAMNSANYLGISSWRLPEMYDIGNDGCTVNSLASYNGGDCGYNVVSTGPQAAEMASLFYVVERATPSPRPGAPCSPRCSRSPPPLGSAQRVRSQQSLQILFISGSRQLLMPR